MPRSGCFTSISTIARNSAIEIALPGKRGCCFCSANSQAATIASNAVNLTDGLDGLAIVPSMMAVGCFAFIAYMVGNLTFATYLQLPHVAGVDELTVFCGAM